MRRFILACLVVCPLAVFAQSPPRAAAPADATSRQATETSSAAALAVRRVILYKTGVGYFEHLGTVRGRQNVTVRFTSAQLNDVLKSLTVLDLGNGHITGISYNSVAPLEQRLGALRLPLDENTTSREMLASLRGARVEVAATGGVTAGRLLGIEQKTTRRASDATTTVDVLSLITDAGELRTFELSPAVRVRILERDLRQEVGRYLDLVGSGREQDVRNMVIASSGSGDRQLFVSYISEVPIWKSTYRLVLPAEGKPFLQGWAIVDNTIGEDWRNVELSLVAGAPQSFIQNIAQPYYTRRPVVGLPAAVLMTPQTHQGAFGEGAGTIAGFVRDPRGSALPGVTVRLFGAAAGGAGPAVTGGDGRYSITAPAGVYTLRFELAGFTPRSYENWRVQGGTQTPLDVTMQPGGVQESVAVTARRDAGRAGPVPGGVVGGVVGGLPAAPPPPAALAAPDIYAQARYEAPAAEAATLADLFEYRIKEPITLRKNQSALVPIFNADVTAEKVSIWNRGAGSGRPIRAVWLTNATNLTLDGGSITVVDGNAFAGEGLVEPLKAGERRLISYAADLGVMVTARRETGTTRVFKVRAREGIIIQETEERATWTYRARNENAAPTTLVVEHRLPSGWKLAEGQTPAESTTDAQRFRIVLPPGKETALDVGEVRQGQSSVTIANVDDLLLAGLAQAGVPAAALEAALRPIITKKTEVAQFERQLQTLEVERATIDQDQQRLRENMKALRGSPEEKQLLQRYTRQLDSEETRLDALKQEVAKVSQQLAAARGELSTLIGSASFELVAAPRR